MTQYKSRALIYFFNHDCNKGTLAYCWLKVIKCLPWKNGYSADDEGCWNVPLLLASSCIDQLSWLYCYFVIIFFFACILVSKANLCETCAWTKSNNRFIASIEQMWLIMNELTLFFSIHRISCSSRHLLNSQGNHVLLTIPILI